MRIKYWRDWSVASIDTKNYSDIAKVKYYLIIIIYYLSTNNIQVCKL